MPPHLLSMNNDHFTLNDYFFFAEETAFSDLDPGLGALWLMHSLAELYDSSSSDSEDCSSCSQMALLADGQNPDSRTCDFWRSLPRTHQECAACKPDQQGERSELVGANHPRWPLNEELTRITCSRCYELYQHHSAG